MEGWSLLFTQLAPWKGLPNMKYEEWRGERRRVGKKTGKGAKREGCGGGDGGGNTPSKRARRTAKGALKWETQEVSKFRQRGRRTGRGSEKWKEEHNMAIAHLRGEDTMRTTKWGEKKEQTEHGAESPEVSSWWGSHASCGLGSAVHVILSQQSHTASIHSVMPHKPCGNCPTDPFF